jgi:hypothetical protein
MDLSSLIQQYGVWGASIIAVLSILITGIMKGWFDRLFKSNEKTNKKSAEKDDGINSHIHLISDSDILNHEVFNYIDIWISSKIPVLTFSTEYRTAVFKRYLSIFLKAYKTKLQNFVISGDYKNMDDAKLWKAFLNLTNDIVMEYEREMKDYGIPIIIIEKMRIKNNEIVSLTLDLMENICGTTFYNSENNLLKVYSLLNIELSVLENVLSNSKSVCDSVNGQLKGSAFEGKIEP